MTSAPTPWVAGVVPLFAAFSSQIDLIVPDGNPRISSIDFLIDASEVDTVEVKLPQSVDTAEFRRIVENLCHPHDFRPRSC